MKTKTKRTVKKSTKVKTTTMGKLFNRMLDKADSLDCWVNGELLAIVQISQAEYRIIEDEVYVCGVGFWPEDAKVKLKGDIAEVYGGTQTYRGRRDVYKFRFSTKKPIRLS